MTTFAALPINEALPNLRAALATHRAVVLQAPPGAGKSTGVPLALLDAAWIGDRKIVMLEPRRLAARAVATRMASQLNEPVGRTVGYRTRLDSKVSNATRIEVVTEGILTRRLQRDAALEDTAIVIFDEFHERSLQADLGLALCLDVQTQLRDDLKILVMSATLDGEAVAKLLNGAPIVTSEGRAYPVETIYRTRNPSQPSAVQDVRMAQSAWTRASGPSRGEGEIPRLVTSTILRVIDTHAGDVLVFLPGQGEIRRVQRLLEEASLPKAVAVLPLFGELPPAEQDAAIRPSEPGRRKIVLTTNIAETSLTIEGVRIVIDSGLARRSRFDPATGMSRLESVRISRASADQRRGRAGRLEAGVCYRLWTETEHASLAAHTAAEMVEADLAPLALELASWGCNEPAALSWLDAPPAATLAQARDLLASLQALDESGKITAHGRAMANIGTHPRLAHMLIRAQAIGQSRLSADIAALLGERDLLRFRFGTPGARDVDLRLRLDALRGHALPSEIDVDRNARQRVMRSAAQFLRQLGADDSAAGTDTDMGVLLAWAFPDRIAQSRGSGGRYLLSGGRGAVLTDPQSLGNAEFLVVAELDDSDREARIRLAAPITRDELEEHFTDAIRAVSRIEWDAREQAVVARSERTLGALVLATRKLEPDADSVSAAMLAGIRALTLDALPWTQEARALQARIEFARRVDVNAPEPWSAVSDGDLTANLDQWLAPWLNGITRRDHLTRLDLHAALIALLSWNQQTRLNELAPTHLPVPSGSNIPIFYSTNPPTVSVRLQEMFGLTETPRVGGGRVALLIELLSPARRPVQTTQDLKSFWARGYHDVKKDLKGRYPKHYWPDDPLQAQATARAKPRR
jgi:ATP-dependent helicase HrpB